MIRWLALLLLATLPARAAELAMFDRADCPVCIRWNKEVGPIYPKTPEARRAPFHRVALGTDPGFALAEPVHVTPTFVLVDNGKEIGRIVGYNNDESFWMLMEMLMAKLPAK